MIKFEFTGEPISHFGVTLHRIKALRDFGNVTAGELGGYVEKIENLSHDGNAWVSGNAWVYGNAQVSGDARVYGDAQVSGDARVEGNARVEGMLDFIVFKNWWSSGRWFTWTRSNNMWACGCFHGTGEELVAKAYKDSETSGREYKRVVDYVEACRSDNGGLK